MANQSPHTLPVNQLQPNPFQPRERIKKEDIADLVESVKSYGIIEPLVVAHTPAGYQIIAGERRWRAAREAGLSEVPVVVKKTTPKQMLELALVENVQRQDLNAIERAKGFQQLIREFDFSVNSLAGKIGKSSSYVSNSLRLLDLPDAITDGVIGGEISEGHARAIVGLDSEQAMINCYKQVLKEGASVRRTEQLVRQIKQGSTATKQQEDRSTNQPKIHPKIKSLQQKIKTAFEAPTELDLSRSNRQTRLTITFKGNFSTTEQDLEKVFELLKKANQN